MYYLKIKDNKKRQQFKKFELQYKLKNFLYKNILSSISYNSSYTLTYKKLIYFQILKKKKKIFQLN